MLIPRNIGKPDTIYAEFEFKGKVLTSSSTLTKNINGHKNHKTKRKCIPGP